MPDLEKPCKQWTGARTPGGYGVTTVHGRTDYVHRVTYMQVHGEIPEGTEIDHLCENPPCYEESHLEAVTHQENVRRGRSTKVTPEVVAEIRYLSGLGLSTRRIASMVGVVKKSQVHLIASGRAW